MTSEEHSRYLSSPNSVKNMEDIINGLKLAITRKDEDLIEAAISKLLMVERHADEWKANYNKLQHMHNYECIFRQQLEQQTIDLRRQVSDLKIALKII
jgi:hypothetical protein